MAIDAGRPFPFISNKTVNIAFLLEKDGNSHYALVRLPTVLPRIMRIPAGLNDDSYMFIEEIITEKAQSLFEGYEIKGSTCFRVTRDADLSIDEDDAIDLLEEIEHQVRQRQWGLPVRLEIERKSDRNLRSFLTGSFKLSAEDVYLLDGPLDLSCLMGFASVPAGFPELRYPDQPPVPSDLPPDARIFESVAARDYLVHHPYQSFDCVLRFLEEAASDPDVLAIKQALYRVSGDSP
jgi:polyphosphate kinase